MRYSTTSTAIYSMTTTSPYTLTPLSSTVSNKESVEKSRDLALKSDNDYDKRKQVAESIATCSPMIKQLL